MDRQYQAMRWLLKELPTLRRKQLIDGQTHDTLKSYYEGELAAAPSVQKYLMLVLVGIGACMIAGGIISLLAHNWDMLPKMTRIAAAFIPLAAGTACGVYTIVRNKDERWKECSAVLTAAGVACFTALISQIYHIDGTLRDFMMLVLLVTLPLLYIFRSYCYAALYCFGLFMLEPYHFDPVNLAYLGGILPFLFCHLFLDYNSRRAVFARYLTLPLLVFVLLNDVSVLMGLLVIASTLCIGGLIYSRRNVDFFRNPWLFTGWSVLTVILLIGSYSGKIWDCFSSTRNFVPDMVLILPILFCGLAAALLFCTARRDGKRVLEYPELLVVAASFLLLPGTALFGEFFMKWLCNLYLLILGITLTATGVRRRSFLFFNAGILQIIALAVCRFFDSDFSMLVRGTAFILLGIAFIAANMVIGRVFKNRAGGEA